MLITGGRVSGWVKMHRKLQQSDLWLSEPFSRGQAWVDLIMLANHKAGFVRVRGRRIDVGVGCVARAQKTLADRWKWSRGKVIRFLKELEADGRIIQETSHDFNVISVCNYEGYQVQSTTDGTRDGHEIGHGSDHEVSHETDHETVHIQEQQQQQERKEGEEVSKGKASRAKKSTFSPPDEIPTQDWQDLEEHRKAIKRPMTDRARRDMARNVIACAQHNNTTTSEVIGHAIQKGWTGIGADWAIDTGKRPARQVAAKETHQERGERMAKEREARINGNQYQGVISEQ